MRRGRGKLRSNLSVTKSPAFSAGKLTRHNLLYFLPEVGLEPTWACAHNILSVTCIPFHHSGIIEFLRPRSESNRRIGVLQTPAFPFGYVAIHLS